MGVVCSSLFFDRWLEYVCVCVCVFAVTHIHTAGYSRWAKVWDSHLEGWKNPDQLKRCIHADPCM